ncbi:EAL domain-containing protein [Teichococcus coralli]|nr:EAL domain-containing protein [Pseudoroseomonas coralli]
MASMDVATGVQQGGAGQPRDGAGDLAVFMLDPGGRVASWNAGAARLKGYGAAEIIGKPFAIFFGQEEVRQGKPEALLARALRDGHAEAEGRCLRRDGRSFRAHVTLSLIRDAEGRHVGFVEATRDLAPLREREEALRASEEQFRKTMLHSPIGMALVGLDGTFLRVNRACCALLGYGEAELLRLSFQEITHSSDLAGDLRQLEALLQGRTDSYQVEKRYRRRDGELIWGLLSVSLLRDAAGQPMHFISQIQDISRLKRSETALHEERDRLHVTLCAITDGVISTDAEGRICFMNPAAEAATGWMLEEARHRPIEAVFEIADTEAGEALLNPVRVTLATRRPFDLKRQAVLIDRQGERIEVRDSSAPIRAKDGGILGAVLVFQDVRAVRSIEKELEFSTLHDALTGLPNRRKFEAALASAVDSAHMGGGEHTLCFLDLDRFKIVNDSAGHAAGDALLRAVAQTLSRMVRPTDMVARLGDDEFAILLFGCPVTKVRRVLAPVIEAIAAMTFTWEERDYHITTSIGVASIGAVATSASVMKHADVACYAAKLAGRNRISVYDMEDEAGGAHHREIIMATEIRTALREERFRLHAQRIAAIGVERGRHYELLLRMVGKDGALVSPGLFIPVAERYDLMAELDRWVLREVLQRRAPQLAAVPGLSLAVNISAHSLNDPQFLPFFLQLLQDSPLRPQALTLEITETALVSNLTSAGAMLDSIRQLGCRVALDDFGAGLSSFGYLRAFKVDVIKIDGSFIRNLPESVIDLTIVRSIHRIAHEIGAETVAEFVENGLILERLREIGVDYAQGHAIAVPVDLDELIAELRALGGILA